MNNLLPFVVILSFVVIALAASMMMFLINEHLEQQEIMINQSRDQVFAEGVDAGSLEIFARAYKEGVVILNMNGTNSLALYSPQGCLAAVQGVQ